MTTLSIEHKLSDGRTLKIGFPKLKDSLKLFNAITNKKIVSNIAPEAMAFDEEIQELALNCAYCCVVENRKIDEEFFENIDNRKLFFEIIGLIIKENLDVFIDTPKES